MNQHDSGAAAGVAGTISPTTPAPQKSFTEHVQAIDAARGRRDMALHEIAHQVELHLEAAPSEVRQAFKAWREAQEGYLRALTEFGHSEPEHVR